MANDGFQDLMDVHIPEGSLLKPIRPAALSCRTHVVARLLDLLSGLLGQKAPQFMTAAGFSDSPHFMYSGALPSFLSIQQAFYIKPLMDSRLP